MSHLPQSDRIPAPPRRSVVVVGSANMDLVVGADRIPQPGETVGGSTVRRMVGGKGLNQARAAALAGADVRFAGAVGDDEDGRVLRRWLTDAGVDDGLLHTVEEPTGSAHITVDGQGENAIVVIPGANGQVRVHDRERLAAIQSAAAVVVQLEIPEAVVWDVLHEAHGVGVRTVLTPSPFPTSLPDDALLLRMLPFVDVLVANQHEGAALSDRRTPRDAARVLHEDAGIPTVLITLGADGVLLADDAGLHHVPALDVPVIDTTGAGDTFVGCLVAALTGGSDLRDAADFATAGAALSVQRDGAAASAPTRSQIEALLADPMAARRQPTRSSDDVGLPEAGATRRADTGLSALLRRLRR